MDENRAVYAAQTFNNTDALIRLGWVRLSPGPMAEWGKSPLIPTGKDMPEDFIGDGGDGMLVFQKQIM